MTTTESKLKGLIEEYGYSIRNWRMVAQSSENVLPKNGTHCVCSYRDAAYFLKDRLQSEEYNRRFEEVLAPSHNGGVHV